MWNGAAEALKPMPATIIARPARSSSSSTPAAAIDWKPSSPVAP
jgi:hypothetical protein